MKTLYFFALLLLCLVLVIKDSDASLEYMIIPPHWRKTLHHKPPLVSLSRLHSPLGNNLYKLTNSQTIIEGLVHVHTISEATHDSKENETSPPFGDSTCGPCGGPIQPGLRWKIRKPVAINGENNIGLSSLFFQQSVIKGFNEWEQYINFQPRNGLTDSTLVDGADLFAPDGKNEILFGHIDNPSALAVTFLWGYGIQGSIPIDEREIIECDIVFALNKPWGDGASSSNVFDVQNIATHEVGHSHYGLRDEYASSCSAITMFGTSSKGETKKRTLEPGDICPASELYNQPYTGPIPKLNSASQLLPLPFFVIISILAIKII